jgi:hypothetical protein
MSPREIHKSSLSELGVGAVFETEDGVGFFYLYDDRRKVGAKIVAALRVCDQGHGLSDVEIDLVWDSSDTKVGLEIRGELWAVFNTKTMKGFHTPYRRGKAPQLGKEVLKGF